MPSTIPLKRTEEEKAIDTLDRCLFLALRYKQRAVELGDAEGHEFFEGRVSGLLVSRNILIRLHHKNHATEGSAP